VLEGFIDFFRVKEFPFDEDFAQLLLLFSHGDASSEGVGLPGVRSASRDPHLICPQAKIACRSLVALPQPVGGGNDFQAGKRPVGRSGDNRLSRRLRVPGAVARHLVRGRSLTPGRTANKAIPAATNKETAQLVGANVRPHGMLRYTALSGSAAWYERQGWTAG
jgi:hypothetical protein